MLNTLPKGKGCSMTSYLVRYESQHTDAPEDVAPALDKLSATRWTVRGNAYLKIITNYNALMKLWDVSLTTGGLNSEVKARIIGQRLFSISDNLSKTLQSKAMSALSGFHIAELTIETYKDMRTNDNAQLFFETVAKKALDHAFVCKPELPRKRRRPNCKSIVESMQVDGYNGEGGDPITNQLSNPCR